MRKLNAMPNSRRLARSPLPWWRLLLLLAHYFIGYLFLYPKLLAKITLAIDPNAYYVPDSYLFLTYVWMILSTLLIAFPIWRQSHLHYRKERPDLLFSNLCYMGAMFVVSLVIGLIVTHFSGLSDSANEQVVLAELERSPLLSFFTILIYSPIIEESVFRGGIYRTLRGYMGVVSAMLLTAFAFGLLHVYDSFLVGNWNDGWYLLLYGGVSCLLCYSYEKNQTIYSSVLLHFMNNLLATFL